MPVRRRKQRKKERERETERGEGRVGSYRLSAGVGKRAGFDGFKHGLPLSPALPEPHPIARERERERERARERRRGGRGGGRKRVVKTTRILGIPRRGKSAMRVIDPEKERHEELARARQTMDYLHFAPTMDRPSEMRRNLDLHRWTVSRRALL